MPYKSLNLKVRIKHSGIPFRNVKKTIERIKFDQAHNLNAIAKRVCESIADHIDQHTKKLGKGGLSDYFRNFTPRVRRIGRQFYTAIADAKDLNANFPYWRFLNYGGSFLANQPRRRIWFVPGYWEGNVFKYERNKQNKGIMLTEKSEIKPINFIQHGEFILETSIGEILQSYKASIKGVGTFKFSTKMLPHTFK